MIEENLQKDKHLEDTRSWISKLYGFGLKDSDLKGHEFEIKNPISRLYNIKS